MSFKTLHIIHLRQHVPNAVASHHFRNIGDGASHDRDIHHCSQTIVTCFKYFIITSFLHQLNRDNLIRDNENTVFVNSQILNQRKWSLPATKH